ncbi:MFS transporter [Phaeospirillum tilakii]|uniref:MFS transporter n=1 Tax=Phaeospirillum tilakii TaxID=741673 RepID=A0ABW5C8N0_9PROT
MSSADISSAGSPAQARLALGFSGIGHAYAHIFEPIFFLVALVLPGEFGLSYQEALALIVAGKLLYGLAAPAAGWLGDRWSTVGMMGVFFLGLGGAAVAAGLAPSPWTLAAALTLVGLFGSIYHPVGTAWLLANAVDKGKAIGLNGVFGGVGPALATAAAGLLTAEWGWRAAFIVPGLLVIATGLAFLVLVARGVLRDRRVDRRPEPPAERGDALRAGLVLSGTMLGAGLIAQSLPPILPKLFAERLGNDGLLAAAGAVSLVYFVAGLTQIAAGHLADRFPPRRVYLLAALLQAPLLAGLAVAGGPALLLVGLLAVSVNMAGIPAENVLLARYSPARWRGTAFGLKFVLSFGVSSLAVPLVSLLYGATGGFTLLLGLLAGLALAVAAAATLLPRDRG